MTNWTDGYVAVNGLKLHYYRTGGDKPQVVINHGAGDDGLCWTHIVKELEQDYDAILPDARGHGKSASGRKDYSTEARVADLVGLIEALQLDRPVVGGHSMGADTALHLAANHPHLTRGIFLEDPPVILPGERLGGEEQEIDMEKMGTMMVRFMMTFKLLPKFIGVFLQRKMSPAYPDDEIFPWVDSKRRVSFDFLFSMASMDLDLSNPFDTFRKIKSPIQLFIGDKEKMSIMSQEAGQKAAEANDNLRLIHLEGASHDIRRTRFDGYMPALKAFLSEIYTASE